MDLVKTPSHKQTVYIGIQTFGKLNQDKLSTVITISNGTSVYVHDTADTSTSAQDTLSRIRLKLADSKLAKVTNWMVPTALDVLRELDIQMTNMVQVSVLHDFVFHATRLYAGTTNEYNAAETCARAYANIATNSEETLQTVDFKASALFIREQCKVLQALRLQWYQNQNIILEISDYKLETMKPIVPPTETMDEADDTWNQGSIPGMPVIDSDIDDYDNDFDEPSEISTDGGVAVLQPQIVPTTYFKLTLSEWKSHVMNGTELMLVGHGGDQYLARVKNVTENKIKFVVDGQHTVTDIKSAWIKRGKERIDRISFHLGFMSSRIRGRKEKKFLNIAGHQWVSELINLPTWTTTRLVSHMESETKQLCGVFGGFARKEYTNRMNKLRGRLSLVLRQYRHMMNPEQSRVFESNATCLLVEGYPGTGKTFLLALLVLRRFRALLDKAAGWVLCTCVSNAAARQMAFHLSNGRMRFMREMLTFKFSKTFRAYHLGQYAPWFANRVTRKHNFENHGILICVTGSLPVLFKRFPWLKPSMVDVIIDEASQLWVNDMPHLLQHLPSLQRMSIFGDSRQLPPHICKYLHWVPKKDQPCVASVLEARSVPTTLFSPTRVRLCVSYRMCSQLLFAHASIFYPDLRVIQGRTDAVVNVTGNARGLYLFSTEKVARDGDHFGFMRGEVRQALELYKRIRGRAFKHARDGREYTVHILTPYLDQLTFLIDMSREAGISMLSCSTIDAVQGTEYDVVILLTGRHQIADLTKNENRINVATSRAREVLVIMMAKDFVRTGVTLDIKLDRQVPSFWSRLVSEAKGDWLALLGTDNGAGRLQVCACELQQHVQRKVERHIGASVGRPGGMVSTKVSNKVNCASVALGVCDEVYATVQKSVILKTLFLDRRNYERNLRRPAMMLVFAVGMTCSLEQFRAVLTCYITETRHHERLSKILRILELPVYEAIQGDSIVNSVRDAVSQVYVLDAT